LIDESVGLKKIKQPKMISIMGIRGSGKTALATEVHERYVGLQFYRRGFLLLTGSKKGAFL
jgi:adenylate kinase family enzyme